MEVWGGNNTSSTVVYGNRLSESSCLPSPRPVSVCDGGMGSFLEMAQEVANDSQLKPLADAAGGGDANAMLQLQQAIVNKELGDSE